VFRRLRAARWQVLAVTAAAALAGTGCGTSTSPPKALGQAAQGPIVSLVTALNLNGGKPRGLTQYFAVKDRSVYAAAYLGNLHGATQLVMTWSRQTATGLKVLFSKEVPVSNYGVAYTSAQVPNAPGGKPGTLPLGTYQVSATVAGVTRDVYWTVFTPAHTTAADFAATTRPLETGPSGSLPQYLPKVPCVAVQSSASMPSTTDVRLIVSAYCPQDHRNGPTRGIVVATMDHNAGEYLVGRMKLLPTGILTGSFNLNVCSLPGGSNRPGTPLYFASIVYYRGNSKNYSDSYLLPPAHLAPVVIISSSVPAGAQVYPGQKISLHVTGSEPVAFGAEDPVRSITVTAPGGKVVTSRRFDIDRRGQCGTEQLRKTIKVSYVVPAGAHGPLTLTASSVGLSGRAGRTTITFRVGQ
jgi:hypothetical protein